MFVYYRILYTATTCVIILYLHMLLRKYFILIINQHSILYE